MGGDGGGHPLKSPPPTPMPMSMEDEAMEAKQILRRRYKSASGKESTILAGRLNSEQGKKLLGE